MGQVVTPRPSLLPPPSRIQTEPAKAGPHPCFAKSDLWDFVMHNWNKRKRRRNPRNPKVGAREELGALHGKKYLKTFEDILFWSMVPFMVFEKYTWETQVILKLHLIAGICFVGGVLAM